MTRQYFGTDGIRGRVGQFPITPEFMLKLGWATGKVFSESGKCKILIGKDTRVSGYMFESALEAGLLAAGADAQLLGPMPTPGIAYLTRTLRAQAGIVISASHNPYYDNGIKFFSAQGTKLPDDIEHEIERQLDQEMTIVESSKIGKATRVQDAVGRYIEFCKSTIPPMMQFSSLKMVVDCAHGSTYHIAPHVFSELGAEVIRIGVEPDGLNINKDVGATAPKALQAAVLEHDADLGIALDGDGDRLIMVDHTGATVDGDEILYILAKHRHDAGFGCSSVVGTLMSNFGLEHALQDLGIQLHRAAVGDRYVIEMMGQTGAMLGGESSGHIICADRTTTGDGIVSALQVLVAMERAGKSLYELKSNMKKFPQCMVNVRTAAARNFENSPEIHAAIQSTEKQLNGGGRVLLRPSGTEPLIRVMVEGQDADQVDQLANQLAGVVEKSLQKSMNS